ncbi:MAG: 3'(2'),5'-bisphosphate nucleotidase CysQ [Myxococcota bacterium]
MAYSEELRIASDLAVRAGAILMDIYATEFTVEFKGAADPVTEADKLANEFLVTELRKAFPADGIVAEETEDQSDALTRERCWYVDPLDGTKEFIAKNGEFAVMLGLAIQGQATVGAVYQPVRDKLFTGAVGGPATLRERGNERALTVSSTSTPRELKLVVSRSHRSSHIDAFAKALGITEEHRSGSVGLKIGLIAEQVADVYVHVSDKSSAWDACGPEAILRAAGGRFADLNGDDFRYGGADMRNSRGIVACNAATFDAVVQAARTAGTAAGLIS